MKRQRYRFADASQAVDACAGHILARLSARIESGERATLAISGGTSPKLMFQIFSKTPFDWSRVELFWVDERCVPATDPQSNFKLANDAWLVPSAFPECNIHRIQAERAPDEAARLYAEEIRSVLGLRPGEMPRFDVVHRGMGPDAHTASLFPGEPLIDDRAEITAAVWVEKFKQHRITLLPGVLLAARHTVMLVTGPDKAQALRDVLGQPFEPKRYPAQLATGENDDVAWFLDGVASQD